MITDEYIDKQLSKAAVLGLDCFDIRPKNMNKPPAYLVIYNSKIKQGVLYIPSRVTEIVSNSGSDIAYCPLHNVIESTGNTDIKCIKVLGGSGLTNIRNLFAMLSGKIDIDVSELDTSNVDNMECAFQDCGGNIIGLNTLDTSKVTSMHNMFIQYHGGILDVSKFDTSNVKNMGEMFLCSDCVIRGLEYWDTSNVETIKAMFARMDTQGDIDIHNFNTSKLKDASLLFDNTDIVGDLNMSHLDLSRTECTGIFTNTDVYGTLYIKGTILPEINTKGLKAGRIVR